jgi:hypothetical protein
MFTWSRVLPEKVTGLQLVKKSLHSIETEVHYHIHNSPPPVLTLSHINPVPAPDPIS